jgi:ribonuclease BN (tRNA processing enzyme)
MRCYTGSMEAVRVVFLGSGNAFCAGGRHQASYLVQSRHGSLLLDCGPTVLASIRRHGLATAPIDCVLLSHFHGDHLAGLPFLFLDYVYVEPRTRPLAVAGPPRVEEAVKNIFKAMYPDAASEPLPYPLIFMDVMPDTRVSLGGAEIIPFRVPHQKPLSLGFEILIGGRKIVYTGDSGWTDEFLVHTPGADLFLCECSFFETRMATHLDYPRIAENLANFGAKRIVLTHLGEEVLRRTREVDLELAQDGMILSL